MQSINISGAKYLHVNTKCNQILMIRDKNNKGGLFCSEQGTMSLSIRAFNILYDALISPTDYTIQSLIKNEDDLNWLNDLLKNDMFSLSSIKPCKRILSSSTLNQEKKIPVCFFPQPILIAMNQELTESLFDNIIFYYTISIEDIAYKNDVLSSSSALVTRDNCTAIYPILDLDSSSKSALSNLYPVKSLQPLASACSYCDQCTNCQYCSVCVIPVLALAIISIIAHQCASTVTGCNA